MSTVRITLSEPWTSSWAADDVRPDLSALSHGPGAHFHASLVIAVAGRNVPRLGFWGPNDVCVGTWIGVLAELASALGGADPSRYVFDEGEQGQPAFIFEREGPNVFVSVSRSELSGADGDGTWQRVKCSVDDLCQAIEAFLAEAHDHVVHAAPQGGPEWWVSVSGRA